MGGRRPGHQSCESRGPTGLPSGSRSHSRSRLCTIAGSGRSPSPPLAAKAHEGQRTAPGPAPRSSTSAPFLAAPTMLHFSPGPPGRHRQARPRRSRPQDKQKLSFSPRPGGASLGVGHLARRPGRAPPPLH
ncbi:hypothetical protein NDU88_004969 [Pleurodeles waltl]|uniref:Uncharacterized protein n=1 Tax=Pleurodeles waltl TaxID=8319 RepID=A0AAV7TTI8_PLEWA|nr:hypothetical protein NDU88_004969 [Pleurodeles waltl]